MASVDDRRWSAASTRHDSLLFGFILTLLFVSGVAGDDSLSGPVFLKEPPNRVDFSNTTGTVVECAATGNPRPEITWIKADGSAVNDVPGLRQVQTSGSLVFPPFRAEDYKQEVHAQIYRCVARNSAGSIVSRDIHARAVVQSSYLVEVSNEHVILGNSALLKCTIPSFVADFIRVASWTVVSDHSGELVLDLDSTGRCLFDFQPDTLGPPVRFIFIETAEIIARAEISQKFKGIFRLVRSVT